MSRDAAIEAGARAEHSSELETGYQNSAWEDLDDDTRAWYRRNAAAVIDAAAPHLKTEPIGYSITDGSGRLITRRVRSRADVMGDDAYRVAEYPGAGPYTIVALVPVDEP